MAKVAELTTTRARALSAEENVGNTQRTHLESVQLRTNWVIYQGETDQRRYSRVLRVVARIQQVALFDCDDPLAWPRWENLDEVEEAYRNGAYRRAIPDPFMPKSSRGTLTDAAIKRRDERWAKICPLVQEEDILTDLPRSHVLLCQYARDHGTTPHRLRELLRLFWRFGMTPGALLPSYDRCGAAAEARKPESLLGNPRLGRRPEINISPALSAMMFEVCNTLLGAPTRRQLRDPLAKKTRYTFSEAYDQFVEELNELQRLAAAGNQGALARGLPATGKPSLSQFKNHYYTERKKHRVQAAVATMGERRYNLRARQLRSSAMRLAMGPGSICQIDSQQVGCYLVARDDRQRVIGRLTLYVLIDVFTRYWLSFYATLAPPSFLGAMMTIVNAFADQNQLAREYNVILPTPDPNVCHAGELIVADRAELLGKNAEPMLQALGMTEQICAAYRADWKAFVEGQHWRIDTKFVQWQPGYVDPELSRGDPDYQKYARVTMPEFIQQLISLRSEYNSTWQIKGDLPADYPLGQLGHPTPRQLYEWGIANRSGTPPTFDPEYVRSALLPPVVGKALGDGHLHVNGLRYDSETTRRAGDHLRLRGRTAIRYNVGADERDVSTVVMRDAKGRPIERCRLAEVDERFLGWTREEVHEFFKRVRQADLAHEENRRDEKRQHRAMRGEVVTQATTLTLEATGGAQPTTRDMRDARRAERRQEDRENALTGIQDVVGEAPQCMLSEEGAALTTSTSDTALDSYIPPIDESTKLAALWDEANRAADSPRSEHQ